MAFIKTFSEFKEIKISEKKDQAKQEAKQKYSEAVSELLKKFGVEELYELQGKERKDFFAKLDELLDSDSELKESYELAFEDKLINESEESEDDEDDKEEVEESEEDEEVEESEDDEESEDNEEEVDESLVDLFIEAELHSDSTEDVKSVVKQTLQTFEASDVIDDVFLSESGEMRVDLINGVSLDAKIHESNYSLQNSALTESNLVIETTDSESYISTFKNIFENMLVVEISENIVDGETVTESEIVPNPDMPPEEKKMYNDFKNSISKPVHDESDKSSDDESKHGGDKKSEKDLVGESDEEVKEGSCNEGDHTFDVNEDGEEACTVCGISKTESEVEENVNIDSIYKAFKEGKMTMSDFQAAIAKLNEGEEEEEVEEEEAEEVEESDKADEETGKDVLPAKGKNPETADIKTDKKAADADEETGKTVIEDADDVLEGVDVNDKVSNYQGRDQLKVTKTLRKQLELSGKGKDDVYFDGNDLVYGDETVASNVFKSDMTIQDLIDATKKAMNESVIDEAKIDSEAEFKEYATTVLKKAFADEYDEKRANDVINGLINKHGKDGDWGAAVGALQSGLG